MEVIGILKTKVKKTTTNHQSRITNHSAFTLIEILIVVTILGILGTLTFSMFTSARQRSRNGRRKADLETTRSALEMYRTDNDEYPATADFSDLEPDYIKELPIDPQSTDVNYSYDNISSTSYCLGAYLEGSEGLSSTCGCSAIPDCTIAACNYCVEDP